MGKEQPASYYDPKYFAKLSMNRTCSGSRDYGMNAKKDDKDHATLESCFEEMTEWAKSGIWYANLKTIPENLQEQLNKLGFSVSEYFGQTSIGWANERWGGMEPFEPEKHLSNLESGDLLCGRFEYEALNFYMYDAQNARIGTSLFTINIIEEYRKGNLIINEIQKKSYWQ